MTNAVGYIRVSTTTQGYEGFGLQVQRDQVTGHCQYRGYELVAVCEDVTSGTNGLEDRDGLAEALAMLADGRAEVLVIPRLDRLARDLVMQETLLRDLWKLGEVESCASGESDLRDDPEDPTRRLIRQILGAVAEFERSMIALRLRRGINARKKAGGWWAGLPPYGWRTVGRGQLEPVPEEQKVIERIAALNSEGLGPTAIARELDGQGVPTRHDGTWHHQQVKRIVERLGTVPPGAKV